MARTLFAVSVVCSLTAVNAMWAATPEQVGDYSGTLKTKAFSPSGKTVTKSVMELSIAANDQTTVTLDGVVVPSSALFEATDGLLIFVPDLSVTSAINTSLHFKKNSFKGTGIGYRYIPPVIILESKITLKKVAP
jgi:hypothetical protein